MKNYSIAELATDIKKRLFKYNNVLNVLFHDEQATRKNKILFDVAEIQISIVNFWFKNQTKYGDLLLDFIDEMNIEELKNLNNKTLGLDDDEDEDEILKVDPNKGACSEDKDEKEFCDKSSRFIVLKGIGRISYLTVRKIM